MSIIAFVPATSHRFSRPTPSTTTCLARRSPTAVAEVLPKVSIPTEKQEAPRFVDSTPTSIPTEEQEVPSFGDSTPTVHIATEQRTAASFLDPSPTASPKIPHHLKPGTLDYIYFTPGRSVSFWRDIDQSPSASADKLARRISGSLSSKPTDTPYWLYCLSRSSFFAFQAVASVAVSATTGNASPERFKGFFNDAPNIMSHVGHVYADDLDRVRAGEYKMPWDVLDPQHRQASVGYALGQMRLYLEEAQKVMRRADVQSQRNVWMEGGMYPKYYKNAYHYQTDGWLSTTSADAYDVMTETLFAGRQDGMQRLTLSAIGDYVKNKVASGKRDKLKVVEIAAGTGRFATFVRDNYPHFDYILSDLSPFYLQKARENMAYWDSHTRADKNPRLGSVRFLQANAEELPIPNNSVDIVYSVYLFHELPPAARANVFKEAARVLRPGGLFVLTDSVQIGDLSEDLDRYLDVFEKLNEPWYPSYVRENFGGLATRDGLFQGYAKELCSLTKMLSFLRT